MNISWKLSVQSHTVIVHDAGGILHHHADACHTLERIFRVHDVENVLLAPVSLRRPPNEKREAIHQYARALKAEEKSQHMRNHSIERKN